jgi:hypothetical protein
MSDEQYSFHLGDDPINDEELQQNEAAIFIEDGILVIAFGDNRTAEMELETEAETATVLTLLADPNFWAQFLGSLSVALKKVN